MNKPEFYNSIKKTIFLNGLSQHQVDGIEAILSACAPLTDHRQRAYVLATAYHETAATMRPIEEYGKGKGRAYGTKVDRNRRPYTTPDKLYYGRGYVQLTWIDNYRYLGKLIGQDLVNHPELALDQTVAAKIMMVGMTKGAFTGVKLDTYFNATREDWENARRIINGIDCAEKIAAYGKAFHAALTA
ncbi:glycoside hydrolase family 19 protein [Mucilaginibacter paludis]|uniref:Glycoside hydrolase family 19 n=1 Tax=Mucilaginibacter paludis DSM 18603 TaxID=714943 RepID=H1YAX9_9SPHI|nr:glycoside hydrolase family 19 protein [Mucilaginibacter paludis]EHQ30012.1 glycoside hydrolase family 19 [Mucilaginibacter paludis DSM 18603]